MGVADMYIDDFSTDKCTKEAHSSSHG